ncbi:hypothetical protein QJS04_geneDACA017098 [Acorus gramineus]|uniref:Uncharacterized protein n=1 Tax=Acorus gramineus TaxID=55184 RepID=A0AAV9AWP0_ACOGR|nr:hypothetical protein QJS04_geneDACA017098 [Acorus gramineus]
MFRSSSSKIASTVKMLALSSASSTAIGPCRPSILPLINRAISFAAASGPHSSSSLLRLPIHHRFIGDFPSRGYAAGRSKKYVDSDSADEDADDCDDSDMDLDVDDDDSDFSGDEEGSGFPNSDGDSD